MLTFSKNKVALLLGPIVFAIIQFLPFEGLSPEGKSVLATTIWVAIWWIGEAIDIEATSLLPIILLPLTGALSIGDTTASYGHPFIYLFMGGLILGITIEKWNLHRRIAYTIVRLIGRSEKRLIIGFMVATAFLSMWISNTATAVMLLPIGLSIIRQFNASKVFSRNLMLGIAYSASIGGMGTLIGTPPNIILAGVLEESLGIEITFFGWMLFALPFVILLLTIVAIYLTSYKILENNMTTIELKPLGKISLQEKRVLVIFVLVAFFWITRSFIWVHILPGLNDTIIAVVGAVLLFIIPSGEGKSKLMDWKTARKIPWGVLLIFGAGLTIATGFSKTDLSSWLAEQFMSLNVLPEVLILLIVIAGINFLTEVTSNTATSSMALPLMVTLGVALGISPVALMVGTAMAASCAFMLPVSTPPNAIVYASGRIKISEMVRVGFLLNIISILLIYLFVQFWWPVLH